MLCNKEIIQHILLMYLLNYCVAQRRGTVLTDEYKHICDTFDFSNFDKAEGLNSIDLHRFENQIRGKRNNDLYYDTDPSDYDNAVIIDLNEKVESEQDPKTINGVKNNINFISRKSRSTKDQKLSEIENLLAKVQDNISIIRSRTASENNKKEERVKANHKDKAESTKNEKVKENERKEDDKQKSSDGNNLTPENINKENRGRHWDNWTEWSGCSVTCGKGRQIRWRHCIRKDCSPGESEMEEKTCQMPACSPLQKIFHLF